MDEEIRRLDRIHDDDWIAKHRRLMLAARSGDSTAIWEIEHFEKLSAWLKQALDAANGQVPTKEPLRSEDVADVFLKAHELLSVMSDRERPISWGQSARPGDPPTQIILVVCHKDETAIGVAVSDNGQPTGAWFSLRSRDYPRVSRASHDDLLDAWRMTATYGGREDASRVYGTLTDFLLYWARLIRGG